MVKKKKEAQIKLDEAAKLQRLQASLAAMNAGQNSPDTSSGSGSR
jgi:hypothetical protein